MLAAMKLTNSTWLDEATHDNPTQTLFLALKDGTHLEIPDVNREKFNDLLNHRSPGEFFNVHMKHKAKPYKPAKAPKAS
jgi:hypothetical protein